MGRPRKEIDKKAFVDLVGIGCGADEIRWFFRDEHGPISEDTLSRWCKREFGCTFAEFRAQNGAMLLKIQLRKNQLDLSKKSAAMGIWLGKQYLGQKDNPDTGERADDPLLELFRRMDEDVKSDVQP